MAKFLVNKSTAIVILKDSKIVIPIGGHAAVPDIDVDHQDILDAVNRGWIEIMDETPAAAEAFTPKIEFENAKPLGSLTIPGKEPVPETPAPQAPVDPTPETPSETEGTATKKTKKAAAQ